MLKLIESAIAALKAVPKEHRGLVLSEVNGRSRGGRRRKRKVARRKPGTKRRAAAKLGVAKRKPGPKPKTAAATDSDKAPVKIAASKADKLAKMAAKGLV